MQYTSEKLSGLLNLISDLIDGACMIRDIVNIDSEKCIGCGKCADACVEGAIKMIGGKAALVNDVYCDGLGACLPSCPANAITIIKRDSEPFKKQTKNTSNEIPLGGIPMTACAGSGPHRIRHDDSDEKSTAGTVRNRLSQWPVQLRLIPATAPYLNNCDLLLAADCSAYAYGNFHEEFIKDRIVVIGCPKLDPTESWNKLTDILRMNNIKSITVTRMDVPCCSVLVNTLTSAIEKSGKNIPTNIFTIFADGKIIRN